MENNCHIRKDITVMPADNQPLRLDWRIRERIGMVIINNCSIESFFIRDKTFRWKLIAI